MDPFYVVEALTPANAPKLLRLEPPAPVGISFGKPIKMPKRILAVFSSLEGLTSAGWLGNYFFLNETLIDELVSIGEVQFQQFPVSVCDNNKECIDGPIKIIVPLNNIACMLTRNSDFDTDELDPTDITFVRHLAIEYDDIPKDRHLFRIAELPSALLASAQLVGKFTSLGVRGIKFCSLDEFQI